MTANGWLWILAVFTALIFLGTGVLKLTRSRDEVVAAGLTWAADFSERSLLALGWAEVLGAIGLVLPPLVGLGILTPVTALCLAALMVGATVVHFRRREFLPEVLRSLTLVGMCLVLAYYRFGPDAF